MERATVVRAAPSASRPRRPRLSGRPRRLLRAAHVGLSGAWLGLVVAMLTLGVTGRTTADVDLAQGTYRLMARLGGGIIPPLAVASLASGVALSLLTSWGLVRHWWIVVKSVLALAVIGTAVSLTGPWIDQALAAVGDPGVTGTRLIVQSVAHLVMLTVATVVSVDKPWGPTPRGRKRRRQARRVGQAGDW